MTGARGTLAVAIALAVGCSSSAFSRRIADGEHTGNADGGQTEGAIPEATVDVPGTLDRAEWTDGGAPDGHVADAGLEDSVGDGGPHLSDVEQPEAGGVDSSDSGGPPLCSCVLEQTCPGVGNPYSYIGEWRVECGVGDACICTCDYRLCARQGILECRTSGQQC